MQSTWDKVVDFASKTIGVLVGVVSVIYILGGTILAGRLELNSVPWEIVLSQLPQGFLAVIAATELLLPALAVVVLCALIGLVGQEVWAGATEVGLGHRVLPLANSLVRRLGQVLATRLPKFILAFLRTLDWRPALVFIWPLMGFLILWFVRRPGYPISWKDLQPWIAFAAAFLGGFVCLILLVRVQGNREAWQRSHLLIVAGFLGLSLVPLLYFNAVTLPLPHVLTCPPKPGDRVEGLLIGDAGDHLILGSVGDTGKPHIVVVPSKDLVYLVTFQDRPTLTCPQSSP